MEKRRQAAEDLKASRQKAQDNAAGQDADDTAALDNLLEQLRSGSAVGRRARRTRPSVSRLAAPLTLSTDITVETGNDTVEIARDMLARLKSDGFDALTPVSPTTASAPRRSRRREEFKGIAEELESSPMLTLGKELRLDGDVESDAPPSDVQEGSTLAGSDWDSADQSATTTAVGVEEEGERTMAS